MAVTALTLHVLTGAHNLVDKEELLCEHWSNIKELSLYNVVVPHGGSGGWEGLTSEHINTIWLVVLDMGLLNLEEGLLSVEARILRKSSWHNDEGLGESVDTELLLAGDLLAGVLVQVLGSSDLEGTSTGDDTLVLDGVGDSAHTVTDSVSSLRNRVIVGSLDQDGAGEGVLNTFDESVLVLTEGLLVNDLSETEIGLSHILNGVKLFTTAGEGNTFTVSLLAATDAHDAGSGEDLERRGVNTLLVDDHEVFVGALAELLLEGNDLVDSVVGELTLGSDKLLSLVSVGPEEAGVDFGLFVLKRHVQAENVTVLHAGWEVGVSATVIEDETLNELGLVGHLVLHVHKLDHVQVDGLVGLGNAVDGIDDNFAEGVGELGQDFGVQGGTGNLDKHIAVDLDLVLEGVKETEGLSLSEFHTVNEDTGVHSFTEVALGLAHKLTNEEHVGGGTVTDNIILSSGSTADHGSSRVLDLHLVEQNSAVLGQLNLASASDEHLNGTLGTKVGLEDLLEALSGVDVNAEGSCLTDNISLCVDELKRSHDEI